MLTWAGFAAAAAVFETIVAFGVSTAVPLLDAFLDRIVYRMLSLFGEVTLCVTVDLAPIVAPASFMLMFEFLGLTCGNFLRILDDSKPTGAG